MSIFKRILVAALLFTLSSPVSARTHRSSGEEGPEGTGPRYASAIVIEAETGRVLFEDKPHLSRAPASTVKTMLELLVMEMVAEGKVRLTDSITTSAWASKIGGSQVYLKEGETFPLEDLMKAIAIHSSNDACVAVAEHLAGTAEGFVEMMNQRAQELGLHDTHFTNVHGLDDEAAVNVTSAHDLARIGRELVKHPKILEWSSKAEDTFRDGQFILSNTNHLVGKFPGLDGIKTGYTRLAGFCLVATAKRGDLRLISVVMGSSSNKVRFSESARLLSRVFSQYKKVPIVRQGEALGEVRVGRGREEKVKLVAKTGFSALLRSGQEKAIKRSMAKLPEEHPAPIRQGEALGTLQVSLGDSLLATVEAVAERDVARMTTWEWIKSWL